MKAVTANPALRYRNDAVFRSAERLIASRPAKRRARWFVSALVAGAGLVLGGMFGTIVLKRSRSTASTESTAQAGDQLRPPPSSIFPPPAFGQWLLHPSLDGLDGSLTLATPPTLSLSLRGELRSRDAAPLGFELSLTRVADGKTRAITGTVHYFAGKVLTAKYGVVGEIVGQTLRLHEVAWAGAHSNLPPEREFALEFPSTHGARQLTGTWTSGTERGTLLVPLPSLW